MVISHRLAVVALLGACSYKSATPGPDAPPPPTVAFEFDKSGADEQSGTVNLPVLLSKPSDTAVTVSFAVLSGGSAIPTMDFAVSSNTVTFAPGVTRAEIPVEILRDFDDTESDETFTIALADPVGAELDEAKAIHEVKIADHILPRIKFAQASLATTTDEGTPTSLTIELTAPSEGESTFTLGVTPGAVHPTDVEDLLMMADTIITIPNGATSVVVPLGQQDDPYDEEDEEHVDFTIKGASQNLVLGVEIAATHTIQDNDPTPTVHFVQASSTVNENVGTANLVVTLSAISARPITVTHARGAGTADNTEAVVNGTTIVFTPHSPTVTGDLTKNITVSITDDNTDEVAETVLVTLTNAGANAALDSTLLSHTLTIAEDATDVPTVQFSDGSDSRFESNNTEQTSFRLSAISAKNVIVPFTVSGTAQDGGSGNGSNDYDLSLTSPVTIPAGMQSVTITVTIHEDNAKESNETVILTLGTPTNATLGAQKTYTCTINNDD